MLGNLKLRADKNLLVGFETSDDAGVYKIHDGLFLVQTVDFITPVVDDPYNFGRIAALNSMSDVFAMGGKALTALSVLNYNCAVGAEIVAEMMQGACDELKDAGCTLAGGHTIDDSEIKLGFSVTGVINDGRYYRNCDLREGDLLIYTKKLGIGILSTALKFGSTTEEEDKEVTKTMLLSNQKASEILRNFDVSGVTDITGFGLAGHSYEMAKGSGTDIFLNQNDIPLMEKSLRFTEEFIIPGGLSMNMQYLEPYCKFEKLERNRHFTFFDPQTSGGLLIGVSEKDALKMLKELISLGYEDSAIIGSCKKNGSPSVIIS